MMQKMLSRDFVVACSAWFGILLFILVTNPTKIPVSFVVVPFAFLLLALWTSWSVVCDLLWGTRRDGQLERTIRHLGHMLSVATTICLALQSIGQLSIRDILAVLFVCILGFFYVHRMTAPKSTKTGSTRDRKSVV